jgi:glc operon protein GlcG
MYTRLWFAVVLWLSAAAAQAQNQIIEIKVLTLDGAKTVIAGALEEARRVKAPGGAIAVVDEGGHVLAVERWDNTFPAAAQISIGKARTAALFRKQTKTFEDAINKGRYAMTALPDTVLTPLQGGLPIVINGLVVGAVGMSGAASAQQDEELAMAGIKALQETVGAEK